MSANTRTTVPNLLTYFRLAAVPVLAVAFIGSWHTFALLLFLAAGGTDLIDGYIARRFNQRSQLGAILDPIADKLLMATTFIGLASAPHARIIPWWFVLMLLLKDVIIMSGIAYFWRKKIPLQFGAVYWSKATTLLLILLGTGALLELAYPHLALFGSYAIFEFVLGGTYITAALIVVTTIEYCSKGLQLL